jgi:hypothetical protein
MFSNPISFVLTYIIGSVVALFLTGVIIKRSQKCVSAFYSPLREKYPKSYFKQNKIIKFIRNFYKMDTQSTIHWGYCIYHYIQLTSATSLPIIMILSLFFHTLIPYEKVISIGFLISCGHFGVIALTDDLLLLVETSKCKKIKKENAKYAKKDFYNWRG